MSREIPRGTKICSDNVVKNSSVFRDLGKSVAETRPPDQGFDCASVKNESCLSMRAQFGWVAAIAPHTYICDRNVPACARSVSIARAITVPVVGSSPPPPKRAHAESEYLANCASERSSAVCTPASPNAFAFVSLPLPTLAEAFTSVTSSASVAPPSLSTSFSAPSAAVVRGPM